MTHSGRHYIPAAGQHWRLPFYDLMAKLVGADSARRALVEQIGLRPGERVLDIGTGTDGLAIELKRRHPGADVVGLDPDPKALDIARRKARRAGLSVQFDQGFADALPYADESFDTMLEIGFGGAIRREWEWRVKRGESLANLQAFAHLFRTDADKSV